MRLLPLRLLRPACCWSLVLLGFVLLDAPALPAAPSLATSAVRPARSWVPRILLLNSYHHGYDWSDQETEGLRSTLLREFPRVELSVEYLDTLKFRENAHLPMLASLIRAKYAGGVDLVLALDTPAIDFARRYRAQLFPEVPLVFCGIRDYQPGMLEKERKITGVAEELDYPDTIMMALGLHPDTREVVVLHDYTEAGVALRRKLEKQALCFPRVGFRFLEEMPLAEALRQLKGLPADRLVLLASYRSDPDGRSYSGSEVGRLVSKASPVPVYALSSDLLGSGVVGGHMADGNLQGRRAAGIAVRILRGEPAERVPVVAERLSQPMFDYAALKRFRVSSEHLPQGTVLMNEPVSSYSVNKTVFWAGTVFTLSITGGMIFLYLNIRRRRRLEKVLRMTEAKFRQIFNSAGDAIYIHDLQCRVVEVNEAACELTGYSREDIIGRTMNEPDPEHPDRLLGAQEPVEMLELFGSARYETLHRTSSGDFMPVEVSAKAIEFEDAPAILSIVRDISQRKAMELREKTRLQILEEMATGAPLEDLLTYIVRFVEQESPGSLCSVLVAGETGTRLQLGAAPSLPDFYNQAVDGIKIGDGIGSCGTAAYLKQRVIVSDIENHRYWKGFQPARDAGLRACWSEPVLSMNGELLGTFAVYYQTCRTPTPEELSLIESAAHMTSIAIARVKSEESRSILEMQMRQMQKIEAVGQLAAGLAHDFNNLLTPIFVYADVIRRSLSPDDPNAGKIDGIIISAGKAADLTKQLLSFGRKQILKKEALDLNEVILSLYDLLQRTIRADIGIRTDLTPFGAYIFADRGQMEQILVNLAVNAQDAIRGNGEIVVETRLVEFDSEAVKLHPGMKTGSHVLLCFRDNGCGMPKEVLDRMFEPFYTTKAMGTGTGLGLATVYGIVKQHHGYIEASSQVDVGTSLLIYLPMSSGDAARPQPKPLLSPPQLTAQGENRTILVVDDNELIREMARDLLESSGYRVLVAETPLQARKLAHNSEHPIDLLVADVVMPEMSGPQLYEALAAKFPELPVLYISGYTFDLQLHNKSQGETVHFLPKPFTTKELLSGIQQALK